MAGTVYVFRGTVSLTQSGFSELVDLPTDEVGSATTGPSHPFHFILQPGQYVLEALPDGATLSPGLVGPYRAITVRAGVSIDAPIPNNCK